MRSTILALALGVAFAPSALAQTFESEAVVAMSTNPGLAAERARVRAVRQALPQAWAEALPQVTLDANVTDQDRSEVDDLPAFTIREQPEYWLASVRSSTLLFGSGRVVASTRQARAQIASAVARYQEAVQSVALDYTQAYTDAMVARESLAAQEESLANLEEQARFARANQREGFMTRTDVAQADARVAQARADVSLARARLSAANEAYARIVGTAPGNLEPPPPIDGLPSDLEAALAHAGQEHPALVAAAADIAAADAGVDLAASGGRVRVYFETTNSVFDAMNSQVDFSQQDESAISLRVSVPLFTGGSVRARTRQQRYVRDAARYTALDVERRVREQVSVAWSELQSSRARLEASHARFEAAELASTGIRREQEHGQRSMIDVLNQEQERLGARIGVAEAQRDVALAERRLAASVGEIASLIGVERAANPEREAPTERIELERTMKRKKK